ncbi:MAG: N-acetylneuraminate synthase [Pseudomonadales bacterium]|uniref:N-acetylneuraminate synthase n=1 Tax=Moritella sp. TaxID=78556 RepID=UPI001D1D4AC9|nr:N-acetylneuraminate synthase [Moritella sp.]MCJ8314568.1 N-acetylneuraminate synthase [Pseudomonadales bacterium]NQZ50766.1 N-acetylneuraminate synthase [Moritella sp.]
MKSYIIAEAGVNHNGSEQLALELIDAAAESGSDAVKFQTFKAEKLVAKGTSTAEYQRKQTGSNDQYAMLKKLELTEDFHRTLIKRCEKVNIEFLSTPFDIDSAKFLVSLGMKRIKIPSGELTNLPFIRELSRFNLPMILSTGMSDLSEVKDAINAIQETRDFYSFTEKLTDKLTVLHCTSNYPAKYEDINLKAIRTMKRDLALPIGYSDHTDGIFVSVAAIAMGAVLIEKHFTLDRALPGPDHQASLEPQELKLMVKQIRQIESCIGDGIKQPKDNELPIRDLVRRSVVLATDKLVGEKICTNDLILLRPGTGIAPKDIDKVIGRRLKKSISVGEMLNWQDLAE